MVIFDSRCSQQHEDDRLCHAAQHLQEVLDSRLRFLGDVEDNVLFHCDATKRQPVQS